MKKHRKHQSSHSDGNTSLCKKGTGNTSRLSSTAALIDSSHPNGTLTEVSHKPLPSSQSSIRRSTSRHSLPPPIPTGFNDPTTVDVILRLYLDQSSPFDSDDSVTQLTVDSSSEFQIYLHSEFLRRSKYFSALLSDRWKKNSTEVVIDYHPFNLAVPSSAGSINNHVRVLQLLYSNDVSSAIDSVSTTLALLPVGLELLFEECVTALALLHGLILTAIHNHPNMAFAKAFVAKLLRDFSPRL